MNLEDIRKAIEKTRTKAIEKTRNISNQPSNKYKGKRLGGIALTTLVALNLMVGCVPQRNELPPEKTIATEKKIEDPYEHLDDFEAILKDFKERYAAEYNEDKEMAHSSPNRIENPGTIKIIKTHQTYLYQTKDGQFITHGAYPLETQKFLTEIYGKDGYHAVTDKYGDIEVYQILEGGKVIDSYADITNQLTGQRIETAVISANSPKEEILENLAEGFGQRNRNFTKFRRFSIHSM